MPKPALQDLLIELRQHLRAGTEPINDAERDLLKRVHDDIEETLEHTAEVPIERVAHTHTLLDEAHRELATKPIGTAIRRVAELLAGMGI
ncbi:MAG: DUF4404 family protein [Rhodobacterales bacterium]|nr:DUF4404 family protein [Rhodobacterales bacterium]